MSAATPAPRRPFASSRSPTGLSSPVYVTSAPGDKRPVRRRAGGHDPHRAQGQGRGQALCRPAALRQVRGRAGPALRGVLAELRQQRQALRLLHEPGRATRSSGSCTRARAQRASAPVTASCCEIPDTESNHNGGQLQFGPDGMLYIGDGDGGGGGDQHGAHGNGQNPGVLLGKLLRIDVNTRTSGLALRHPQGQPVRGPGRLAPRDLGSRPAQPVALLVRPRDRRSLDRRRRPERVGGGRPRQARRSAASTSAGTATRAGTTSPRHAPGRGQATHARGRVQPLDGCSITGGYVYRGPRIAAA